MNIGPTPATILVVDDDPAFVRGLDDILSAAGHRVIGELDGQQAVQVLNRLGEAISVAVIDFVTRGITGFELIGALRRRPNGIKIIATLPPHGPDLSASAREVGADLVVRRPKPGDPLDPEKWLGLVQGLLGRNASTAG